MAILAWMVAGPAAQAGKVETWRHDSSAAFGRGTKERVVVSDAGRVGLSRVLRPSAPLDAAHVWDLARDPSGVVYAATGDAGKVFRRDAKGGDWSLAYDASDTQVLSLAVLPDGRVFGGTGPSGQVVEITGTEHPASRPDPSVQYVWDLAADADGNLYAATGPTGQLWKRAQDGAWSKLLDSRHPHLLCLAIAPDRSVYAGSDGEGLVYRVAPDGKVSIAYDAAQNEVRSLAVAPDGTVFAGTAAAAEGTGGGPTRGLPPQAARDRPGIIRVSAFRQAPGTATPKPPAPGENAIYRISPDGAVREVFRARVMIFTLVWHVDDRLIAGTGPDGQLFEVRHRETVPIARLDTGQVLSLAPASDGLLIGTGDPGSVLTLAETYRESGTLTSDVLDAKLISRFGAIRWQAECPEGTSLAIQVRTGNVGEPDETWSEWSDPQRDPTTAMAHVPPGRFAQYRAALETKDSSVTPALHGISIRYQTINLAPELTRIDVPDLSEGDGATRQVQLKLKWEATDPNGDDLAYSLDIRKDGWPDWVRLGDRPLTDKTFDWDTTAVPAGVYRVRVTAMDRPSNPPDEALTRERMSEPFLVDHQAPGVTVNAEGQVAQVAVKDELTRIVRASYALDGGDWIAVFPNDRLFDTRSEAISIDLPRLKAGTHVLTVRATDAAGNSGAGDVVFETR
jgi:hypothetical protein